MAKIGNDPNKKKETGYVATRPGLSYTDGYLNRTNLNGSLPYADNAVGTKQYSAIWKNGLTNYYKDKPTAADAGKFGLQNMVALPSYAARNNEADSQSKSSGNGSGASGASGGGSSPYVAQLNALYDQVMNRKPFQYDLNGDLLYRQMADQYTQLGQQAMRDTMGQAAALTGGYGNSYAQQVGNQAYQQYLTALNQQVPELYDRAYNAYQDETDRLLQQYELAAAHPSYLAALTPQTSAPTQVEEDGATLDWSKVFDSLYANGKATSNAANAAAANQLADWLYKLNKK